MSNSSWRRLIGGILLIGCGACSKTASTTKPDASMTPDASMASTGPSIAFTIPAVGSPPDLHSLPWPSDLYLNSAGHPVAGSLAPLADTPFLDGVRADLLTRDGFGVSTGAFFTPPAKVDVESLTGHFLLLDLEGGEPVPVTPTYRADGLLNVNPLNGHVLLQQHRYAFVITSGVTADGVELAPSADFAALRDATSAPTDARLASGWAVMSTLFEGLDADTIEGGPARSDLICATVFTTQSITALLEAAHDVIATVPLSTPQVAYLYAADPQAGDYQSLDDLMATPDTTLPGCVSSCTDAAEGILHDQMAFVIDGAFTVPDFLAPTVPSTDPKHPNASVQGRITVDSSGNPMIQGTTEIPFTIVLPKLATGATYANTPVVIYQHGLGGDRESLLAVANTLAKSGLATIGIDMAFHGLRQQGAVDVLHNIGCVNGANNSETCTPGADGFADSNGDAIFYFFDALPTPGTTTELDPSYVRGSFQQAVIDLMGLVRLVGSGSFASVGQVDSRLAGLSFRPGPYMYLAESFGSIMGGMLFAVEPQIAGGTLLVAGGGIFIPISIWSADFEPLCAPLVTSAAKIDDQSSDTPETSLAYNLLQQLVESGDPLALAPYVIQHPLTGEVPKHVLSIMDYEDETVPNIGEEAFAVALGLPVVSTTVGGTPTIDFMSPTPVVVPAPVSGNILVGGTPVTGALVEMMTGTHGMLARQIGWRTVDTTQRTFPPLPAQITINNPIQAIQDMATSFTLDYYAGRVPTVADAQ